MNESQDELFQQILKNAFETESLASGHLLDDEDLLLRWTENQLSAEEHQQLLSHMAKCSDCRKNVSDMIKRGILVFQQQDHPELERGEGVKIVSAGNPAPPRKHSVRFLGVMMTIAACLFIGFCFLFSEGPVTQQILDPPDNGGGGDITGPGFRSSDDFTGPKFTMPQRAPGPKYALLVGINDYANLPQSQWLKGCHNDVAEVKDVLITRFGFLPENITVLLDEQATAEGIRTQFRTLVRMVEAHSPDDAPAQVVFYFSGHGSRIADQPPGHPDHDSEDGYDSTIVVYDSEKQGGETDIRDDEINRFAHDICKDKKGELMIVLDSCYSGGGARGGTRFRGIDRNLPRPTPEAVSSKLRIPKTLPEGAVFFSACQSNQKEPEHRMTDKTYGLFTFYFTQLLRTEAVVSSLDYRTLRDAIHAAYARDKIMPFPTPTVEGDVLTLRKTVLAADISRDFKPYFETEKGTDTRSVRMQAGSLAGITAGSLYELFARVEDVFDPGAESLGWFEITKVEGAYSVGAFFRWADAEQTRQVAATLPSGFREGYAVVRFQDFGDNFLAVRVEDAATGEILLPGTKKLSPAFAALLKNSGSGERSSWLRWVGKDDACDVVLCCDFPSGQAAVFPAMGSTTDTQPASDSTAPASLRGGWGPIPLNDAGGVAALDQMLQSILKAVCLKRVIAMKDNPLVPGKKGTPLLEIKLLEALDNGETRPIPVHPQVGLTVEARDGREYQLRIKNSDSAAFFLTVLCIDPNMQIDALSFGPEADIYQFDPSVGLNNKPLANRLGPGQEFVSQFGFSAPYGTHTFVVLATREPSNFLHLVQRGQASVRTAGSPSATHILQFLEDQCDVRTRATKRRTPPRNDAWTAISLDVVTEE